MKNDVCMDSSHQEVRSRPASVHSVVGIMLTLGIGLSTCLNACAVTARPTSLSFQAVQGGIDPPSQFVSISKTNNKPTTWTASDSATWVLVIPQTEIIKDSARVAVSVAGLTPGTYSATVTVTVFKGGSVTIPVTLTVVPSTTTG
jgi:hypothetical protein